MSKLIWRKPYSLFTGNLEEVCSDKEHASLVAPQQEGVHQSPATGGLWPGAPRRIHKPMYRSKAVMVQKNPTIQLTSLVSLFFDVLEKKPTCSEIPQDENMQFFLPLTRLSRAQKQLANIINRQVAFGLKEAIVYSYGKGESLHF